MTKIKKIVFAVVAVLIFFIGVSFSYRNYETVSVDLYFYTAMLPLAVLLFLALALGVALGFTASLPLAYRLRRKATNKSASLPQPVAKSASD